MINGQIIKKLRLQKKWTADELATRISISRPNYYNYESGKVLKPNPTVLAGLARELEVPIENLFLSQDESEHGLSEGNDMIAFLKSQLEKANVQIERLTRMLEMSMGKLEDVIFGGFESETVTNSVTSGLK